MNPEKTLAFALQSLEERRVVVELRNETTVEGLLDCVDAQMNMDLDDATITRPDGRPAERVDHIHIRGRLVRYVQIPPEIDIVTAINERKLRMARARAAYQRKPKGQPAAP